MGWTGDSRFRIRLYGGHSGGNVQLHIRGRRAFVRMAIAFAENVKIFGYDVIIFFKRISEEGWLWRRSFV